MKFVAIIFAIRLEVFAVNRTKKMQCVLRLTSFNRLYFTGEDDAEQE